MMTHWREVAIPIIAAVLKQYPEDGPERRKALRDAYPFGERAHFPYKVWLDEIAWLTGKKRKRKPKKPDPIVGQLSILETSHD